MNLIFTINLLTIEKFIPIYNCICSFSLLVQRKRTKRKDPFSKEFLSKLKIVWQTPRRYAPEFRSFAQTILPKRIFFKSYFSKLAFII